MDFEASFMRVADRRTVLEKCVGAFDEMRQYAEALGHSFKGEDAEALKDLSFEAETAGRKVGRFLGMGFRAYIAALEQMMGEWELSKEWYGKHIGDDFLNTAHDNILAALGDAIVFVRGMTGRRVAGRARKELSEYLADYAAAISDCLAKLPAVKEKAEILMGEVNGGEIKGLISGISNHMDDVAENLNSLQNNAENAMLYYSTIYEDQNFFSGLIKELTAKYGYGIRGGMFAEEYCEELLKVMREAYKSLVNVQSKCSAVKKFA